MRRGPGPGSPGSDSPEAEPHAPLTRIGSTRAWPSQQPALNLQRGSQDGRAGRLSSAGIVPRGNGAQREEGCGKGQV